MPITNSPYRYLLQLSFIESCWVASIFLRLINSVDFCLFWPLDKGVVTPEKSVDASQIFHGIEHKNHGHGVGMIAWTVFCCIIAHWTTAMAIHRIPVGISCLIHTSLDVRLFDANFILPRTLFEDLQRKKNTKRNEMKNYNFFSTDMRNDSQAIPQRFNRNDYYDSFVYAERTHSLRM